MRKSQAIVPAGKAGAVSHSITLDEVLKSYWQHNDFAASTPRPYWYCIYGHCSPFVAIVLMFQDANHSLASFVRFRTLTHPAINVIPIAVA